MIRTGVELITTDVIVRDNRGQFIADLKKDEFEVFEDGVKQQVVSFTLTHGGRVYNVAAPPPPPPQEGIILPPARPTNDAAGRIFLIFVDDLHLDFRNTGRIRELFKKIAKELIHEGDMFGIVSTGPSSLADRSDLRPQAARAGDQQDHRVGAGAEGHPRRARRARRVRRKSATARTSRSRRRTTSSRSLAQVHNRRKAFIYVSNGYDFNPFKDSRKKAEAERYGRSTDNSQGEGSDGSQQPENDPFKKQGQQFVEADLVSDLSWLTRNANRANVTMYTIDPRGLVGMPDLDEKVDMVEWQNYVRTSQDSLRTIAELTGGYAAVNQNDFDKALKRIDAETSDYYVIGYYSNNPDPRKRNRSIEIKVTRPDVERHAPQGVHAEGAGDAVSARARRRDVTRSSRLLCYTSSPSPVFPAAG